MQVISGFVWGGGVEGDGGVEEWCFMEEEEVGFKLVMGGG